MRRESSGVTCSQLSASYYVQVICRTDGGEYVKTKSHPNRCGCPVSHRVFLGVSRSSRREPCPDRAFEYCAG